MEERKESQRNQQAHSTTSEEVTQKGGNQNTPASPSGTTDMDKEPAVGNTTRTIERSSDTSTKSNITGSEYDGQAR